MNEVILGKWDALDRMTSRVSGGVTETYVSMVTQPDGFRRRFDHVARWAMG